MEAREETLCALYATEYDRLLEQRQDVYRAFEEEMDTVRRKMIQEERKRLDEEAIELRRRLRGTHGVCPQCGRADMLTGYVAYGGDGSKEDARRCPPCEIQQQKRNESLRYA
jgi:ssDNA-binding Zn-finger/Zn-ribbon topoisomerase 1